jgi:hypothetical protein
MEITPIKKIFNIIDSCVNLEQLKTCKNVVDLYIRLISKHVINHEIAREVLYIKINEKKEEMNISFSFNGKIRRRKIKIMEPETEFAENYC